MGFFSKTCAVSHLPVMAPYCSVPELSQVVALLPNGAVIKGEYDGYGRIYSSDADTLFDLMEKNAFDKAKFVLQKYYKPEITYASAPISRSDPGQGYFHDDDDLVKWLAHDGFESYDDYCAAYAGEETGPSPTNA